MQRNYGCKTHLWPGLLTETFPKIQRGDRGTVEVHLVFIWSDGPTYRTTNRSTHVSPKKSNQLSFVGGMGKSKFDLPCYACSNTKILVWKDRRYKQRTYWSSGDWNRRGIFWSSDLMKHKVIECEGDDESLTISRNLKLSIVLRPRQ